MVSEVSPSFFKELKVAEILLSDVKIGILNAK
jgi:hypothetical protein